MSVEENHLSYQATGNTGGIKINPEKLAQADEKELFLMLTSSAWKQWDEASRLAILQEMENRQAKLDGRPAIKVLAEKLDKRLRGQHRVSLNGQEVIILNDRFLKRSKLFGNQDEEVFSVAAALNTLLHEGRHSFQHNAVKNHHTGLTQEQLLEWAASMPQFGGRYIRGENEQIAYLLYSFQGIEEDARRFARRRIAQIHEFFLSQGIRDANYVNQVISDRNHERMLVQLAKKTLTLDRLNELEASILNYFSQRNPEIDISKLTLFDNARLILQHPEINDPDKLLDMMDRNADRKLGLKDETELAFSESLERKLF